ncbi:hypothetical protein P691DRAFT_807266 [Macrolepiota fuliginosa MF-IS2]|uniref:Uncharacterized protein n=1 Tax=Macrolepiota fuliginosa MF-IS2 TaxID=1400762 RepID=A0A9P5XHU2_9AGAR|nr:hypothetical protein P691DRAFT_807266 [Macrolepiota fuliginosa MF-IS2]
MSPITYPNSMPTPPFSPNNQQLPPHDTDNPLKSTINLLDSLVAFYQHERMWVYRTRAVLEQAFDELPTITPSGHNPDSPQENPLPSPPESSSSSPSESTSASVLDTDNAGDVKSPRPRQLPSRWMRRKRGFKLKLEGIAKPRRSPKPLQRDQQDQDAKEHILQLFEKMMEDRMESCQRVNKLVRTANRAYLNTR